MSAATASSPDTGTGAAGSAAPTILAFRRGRGNTTAFSSTRPLCSREFCREEPRARRGVCAERRKVDAIPDYVIWHGEGAPCHSRIIHTNHPASPSGSVWPQGLAFSRLASSPVWAAQATDWHGAAGWRHRRHRARPWHGLQPLISGATRASDRMVSRDRDSRLPADKRRLHTAPHSQGHRSADRARHRRNRWLTVRGPPQDHRPMPRER